ncbi:hypothetical protein EhV456 [Emiliania huxleyi virus 86]|uniref:Uncharacterized protein n=1 Tax=Emiliania huxleyi virus 86 (isolate United Kingdom/English Channel/1999) TaxID=654925 RepID=Q4A223_EHV8U|nr:hypothetical protein EhV456 [Emiliania huxleyi virus 86]AEO97997.1 hypothetical protein ENVG_00101 [Emiliania huxleyi virus 84]AEP15087.1 hypothetical protein EOVG_00150 [Emiliania huxleyi virus 88]AHA55085.1 hypothetical protein EhV145_00536 [Emiliania huxleyi virus 145]AHA56088.1 hypothetical protein EhV164_00501 [Emiliania huxleyi virus 164]CAI65883.1 hypothetical protein EhV456 [Emiliania huxleyi virus 86]
MLDMTDNTYNVTEVEPVNAHILRCTLVNADSTIIIDINNELFPLSLGDTIDVSHTSPEYEVNYTTITNTTNKQLASAGGLLVEFTPSINAGTTFTIGLAKVTSNSSKRSKLV